MRFNGSDSVRRFSGHRWDFSIRADIRRRDGAYQSENGSAQGNANYELYSLAATNPSVFHDITVGNNSVPCSGGVAVDCNNASASTIGELEIPISATQLSANPAFATGTGYDLATGLGSINVGNLLAAWPSSGSFTPTTTTIVSLRSDDNYTRGNGKCLRYGQLRRRQITRPQIPKRCL